MDVSQPKLERMKFRRSLSCPLLVSYCISYVIFCAGTVDGSAHKNNLSLFRRLHKFQTSKSLPLAFQVPTIGILGTTRTNCAFPDDHKHCTSYTLPRHNQGKRSPSVFVLNEQNERKKLSFSRAGGRSRKRRPESSKRDEGQPTIVGAVFDVVKKAIPVLLLLMLTKGALGFLFGGGSSNVVYYSSTVYEKTYYNENGEVERMRKENIRSNMPSLRNEETRLQGEQIQRKFGVDAYLDSLDEDLENIDREIERISRSAISNDFF